MASITILDQRPEQGRIVVVIQDPPANITEDDVRRFAAAMRRRFSEAVPVQRGHIPLNRLQAALDAGAITQAVFDALVRA